MTRPVRSIVLAITILFAIGQTASAGPNGGGNQQDTDPFWFWALVAVGVVLLTPGTAQAPTVQGSIYTFDKNINGVRKRGSFPVPPGRTVQENITAVNGQIVETFTLRSIDTTVQGQGFVSSFGAVEGAADDSIDATWVSADPFSSVEVDIPLSGVQVGVGDLVLGPNQEAFSSLALTVNLVLPEQDLSFPIFNGLATATQTTDSGPTFSATGDWASCFAVGTGSGPDGGTGTFDTCSTLPFSKTVELGMTLPAGTDLELDFQLTAQGIASSVPEQSTWVMMLLGFGGLGYRAYRRGRKDRVGPAFA